MSDLPAKPLRFMLICGEPSGDQLGAQLMEALRILAGDRVTITGVGGPAMAARGLQSLFPLNDTAVMGLREVVPKIPKILRRVRDAADFALATHPDAVVLIDSPDFTHRIGKSLKISDPTLRIVNYVAPQVWASRQYRVRKMARYVDLVLALLPFEVSFFEKHGIHAKFVGHPVIERKAKMVGGEALRERLGIAPDAPLLAVLPGSRSSEIRFILPQFRDAVRLITARVPALQTIIPVVPLVSARVRKAVANWPTPLHLVESEDDKFAAFDAADAALAASGTVTTELALARTSMVVGYRVGSLTYRLALPFFNIKYFTLVNLLLDRLAVPEFLQSDCNPRTLADAVVPLLTDQAKAAAQVHDLDEAARLLGEGGKPPSLRAAQALLDFVQRSNV